MPSPSAASFLSTFAAQSTEGTHIDLLTLNDCRVVVTLHHGLGLGWVWVGFWVGLQRRKPNPEKTQPINPNPENSGLTQYIQIVMVVFMVVSQSEGEGHFLPSDMAVSHLLSRCSTRPFSHLLIWSLSCLLIRPFLARCLIRPFSRLLIRPFLAF